MVLVITAELYNLRSFSGASAQPKLVCFSPRDVSNVSGGYVSIRQRLRAAEF